MGRAAYGGVVASAPFLPLPDEYTGQALVLRIHFLYNPRPGEDSDSGTADQTKSSESVRLSEILVSVPEPPPGTDGTQDFTAARLKAEELLAQIRAGKSFEDVAGKNPDVGYFRRGQLSKSLEDVVFAMKVGDVSNVIRTKQGFVILKVTDHLQSGPKPPATSPQTPAPPEPAKPNQ